MQTQRWSKLHAWPNAVDWPVFPSSLVESNSRGTSTVGGLLDGQKLYCRRIDWKFLTFCYVVCPSRVYARRNSQIHRPINSDPCLVVCHGVWPICGTSFAVVVRRPSWKQQDSIARFCGGTSHKVSCSLSGCFFFLLADRAFGVLCKVWCLLGVAMDVLDSSSWRASNESCMALRSFPPSKFSFKVGAFTTEVGIPNLIWTWRGCQARFGPRLKQGTFIFVRAHQWNLIHQQVRYQVLGEKNTGPSVLMLHGLLVNASCLARSRGWRTDASPELPSW